MVSLRSNVASREDGILTFRALLLGILAVILVCIAPLYSLFILHSALISVGSFPLIVVSLLFLIAAVLNPILKSFNPRWILRPQEIAIILVMMLLGASFQPFGMFSYLFSVIAAPYYFASPENRWAEYLFDHIPNWIVPSGSKEAIRWFWEGLPQGQNVPWRIWIIPLFWWLSFVGAIFLVCFCIVSILRRQWIEKERVIFPLVEPAIQIIKGTESGSILSPLLNNRLFWIGFAIPFFVIVWNIAHYFSPLFPHIPIEGRPISIAKDFPSIETSIAFHIISFGFFASLDVLCSIWFFYLLSIIQIGVYNRLGFNIGSAEVYCSGHPAIGWQSFGALIVIVVWSLWMARGHLKKVFREAFIGRPNTDDTREILSSKKAVWGFILGSIFVVGWLHRSGMSYKVLFPFLMAVFIILIGLTRIVSEGGLVKLRAPLIPQSFTIHTLGSSAISPSSMTALAFSYAWFSDLNSNFLTTAFHCVKMVDSLKLPARTLFKAMCIAVLVSLASFIWYSLYIGYHHGSFNFGEWIYTGGAQVPFDTAINKMKNPSGPDWNRISFLGIGSIIGAGLIYMKYRFIWWPLSPLGFAVASTLPVKKVAFSIFLAWLAKATILKAGGVRAYRSARPFFVGLLVGFSMGVMLSFLVDIIWFPGQGHGIPI